MKVLFLLRAAGISTINYVTAMVTSSCSVALAASEARWNQAKQPGIEEDHTALPLAAGMTP